MAATIPSISIVVPNYNGGTTIDATLRSLIDQDYPRLEILVVDGGSADNSVDVIRRYEQHIAWWISEKDSGQSNAINKGFARATGESSIGSVATTYYCLVRSIRSLAPSPKTLLPTWLLAPPR